ncbi:MAG TPA: hypothetical protein VIT43_14575, partial [Candidatus Dormibacteraeota bacterium]
EQHSVERRLARLGAPHRLTDKLLDQLEELNMDDVPVVPTDYEPALAELRAQLADHDGIDRRLLGRLQSGSRTADVIDTIFAIQEVLAPPTLPAEAFPFDEPALM